MNKKTRICFQRVNWAFREDKGTMPYGVCWRDKTEHKELTTDRAKVTCPECKRLLEPKRRFEALIALLKRQHLTPDIQYTFEGNVEVTCETIPTFKAKFLNYQLESYENLVEAYIAKH